MLTNQGHELTRPVLFDFMPSLSLNNANQFLRLTRLANWNHQTTTNFQLCDQGIGNACPPGLNQDPIIGTVSAQTERAVKSFDRSVVDSQFPDASLRFACQVADALNRVDLICQLSENCGLIT